MNDPGALFANVPGILGFYPEESVIVLCLNLVEETTSRYQLGQVVRVDSEDIAQLMIAPEIPSDLLLALVVSQESPAAEQITEVVEVLTSLTNLRIEAVWHTPSITEGEPLTLLSGEQLLSQRIDWVFGTVPSIFQAPATQESLHQGRDLDLTREEATGRFNRVAMSADHQDSLAEAVDHRLRSLGSVDSPSPDVVQNMITELREILGTPRVTMEIDSLNIEDLSLALALFDEAHPEVRDLTVWEVVEHPGVGGPLALAAAQHAVSDETRASALCAYFLSAHRAGAASRAGLALRVAQQTAPGHSLTRLLSVAHSCGETDGVFEIIKKGVDVSRAKYGVE